MTDKEILKRVEDRLDVAITLLTLSGDKYSAQVVTDIFNYIGKCKHVQNMSANIFPSRVQRIVSRLY